MTNPLRQSLHLASSALSMVWAEMSGQDHDPLRLNLPPLDGARGPNAPNPAILRAAGALYLAAELEQTGLNILAKALVEQRLQLDIRDRAVHEKLEQYHQASERYLDQRMRGLLFARLFGFGSGIADGSNRLNNGDFLARMAMLCNALLRAAESLRTSRRVWPEHQVALQSAGDALLRNLGPQLYGNTLAAARMVNEQLNCSVELLGMPALLGHYSARSIWDLLSRFWEQQAPDFGRYLDRGRCGQEIFAWLADHLAVFQRGQGIPGLAPGSPVFTRAACWLRASGLESG